MRLRVGASTDTGRVRTLNEDVYVLREDRGLFIVCDGMGGAPAGEVASQLAADVILERLETGDEGDASGDSASSYLPWTNRLGEAVRLGVASPDERAAAIDPRAISIRSAALGRAGVRRARGRSSGRT